MTTYEKLSLSLSACMLAVGILAAAPEARGPKVIGALVCVVIALCGWLVVGA